ncbi:hypothetical protein E2C01_027870 [Portunus trituberculatus]|uniref:Uncharacterized protein n=1 Tax=Portunus trituberculatus TaxID=210409 RepID=A0A5B7EMT6_PORTR|nr:hypothetical protein [Portunus trituberculatus]
MNFVRKYWTTGAPQSCLPSRSSGVHQDPDQCSVPPTLVPPSASSSTFPSIFNVSRAFPVVFNVKCRKYSDGRKKWQMEVSY